MNAPATPEQSNSPFDMTKIKTTAIILLAIGCLILPIGIANFVHARPYCFAAPFFCIALAVAIFAKKPKAIPYIFVANLVLEIPRFIYYFWSCFQCRYTPTHSHTQNPMDTPLPGNKYEKLINEVVYYTKIDGYKLAISITLTLSCFLLLASMICAVYWLFQRKEKEGAEFSVPTFWSLRLFGFSYFISEITYIIQLHQSVDDSNSFMIPIDIVIVVFNAVIGVMLTKSLSDLFGIFPHLEQIAQEEAAKRVKQQPAVYRPVAVPAPTPVAQPRVPVNVTDEIMKYKQLLDMGAITQEEYDQKKTELLHTNS